MNLAEPNIANSDGDSGTWTMIYDEGFEVKTTGKTFFAFMRYAPKANTNWHFQDQAADYISDCEHTMTGWYHTNDMKNWGCWRGRKEGTEKMPWSLSSKLGKNAPKHGKAVLNGPVSPSFVEPIVSPFSLVEESSSPSKLLATHRHPQHDSLPLESTYVPDYKLVEDINKDETSTWQAAVHEQFIGKKMKEMLHLLGGNRKKNIFKNLEMRRSENRANTKSRRVFDRAARFRAIRSHHSFMQKEKDGSLPSSFDWRHVNGENFDSEIRNQRSCGSCYAMASVSAMEARIRIASKNKHQPSLSAQHILSCSQTNQGCEGGYPYLVGKFAKEQGIVEENDFSYTASDSTCKDTGSSKRWWAKGYEYVGGFYGSCNAEAMMEEIHKNGPIMAAFQAPSSLFYYKSGIYHGPSPRSEEQLSSVHNSKTVHKWQATNHAVVIVGWGEENNKKYWIVKNTWGPTWGENGYFRIVRGSNDCAIESMAVAIHVDLDH
jgi:cathepsin C